MNFLWAIVFAGSIQSTTPDSWAEHALAQDSWLENFMPYEDTEDVVSFLKVAKAHGEPKSNDSAFMKDGLLLWRQESFLNDPTLPRQWQQEAEPRTALPTETGTTDPLSATSAPPQLPESSSETALVESASRAAWFLRAITHYSSLQTSARHAKLSIFFDKRYYYGMVHLVESPIQMFGRNVSMGYRITRDKIILLGGYGRKNCTNGSLKGTVQMLNVQHGDTVVVAPLDRLSQLKSGALQLPASSALDVIANAIYSPGADRSMCIVATISTNHIPQSKEAAVILNSYSVPCGETVENASVPSPINSAERASWFLENGKPFIDFRTNIMNAQSSTVFSQCSYHGICE
ncbi:hypothetical protein PSACC_01737 [Paramicrosporidium saccamoebae]|uniref:Uncharacterized protein n=1 Tax=Paramicrosporidium saccamoebae TaxID=1246581 RepID=A0A2H9TL07_9FUNG|nr:hypothetical protein PSACC_01737 [Paramicrosporidium saccamoebae]